MWTHLETDIFHYLFSGDEVLFNYYLLLCISSLSSIKPDSLSIIMQVQIQVCIIQSK